jgi:hypothetical protein
MTTIGLVDIIILPDVRCIDTLELSGEIVEKKIGEFKSVQYNKFVLFMYPNNGSSLYRFSFTGPSLSIELFGFGG